MRRQPLSSPGASYLLVPIEIKTKTMLPFVLFLDDIVVRYTLRSDQVRCCNLMDGLQTDDSSLLVHPPYGPTVSTQSPRTGLFEVLLDPKAL